MAMISPVSAALRLTINTGMDGSKQITKTVSLGNISESASADALAAVAAALGGLLEYPVAAVKKYSVGMLGA